MGNYASIAGLMHASLVGLVLFGAILVVSSITEADVNLREIKISKWNSRRRTGVGIVGFMLMIPGLLLLKGTLKRKAGRQDSELQCLRYCEHIWPQ